MKKRALQIRCLYEDYEKKVLGKSWTRANLAQGFIGDVGDLMKLLMAKDAIRVIDNVDEKLEHEFADCLWSLLVLADKYDIDLNTVFEHTMTQLEQRIQSELTK